MQLSNVAGHDRMASCKQDSNAQLAQRASLCGKTDCAKTGTIAVMTIMLLSGS
jgi:hypothetical protein